MPTVLTNARLVLPDAVITGTLAIEGATIGAVEPGPSRLSGAIDCGGDLLLPGLIDLHTDNLERQVQPRPGTRWPSRSALVAHDAQSVAAGVTTVFDALCVGDLGFQEARNRTCAEGAADLAALAPTGALKAEHFLHLRCELPAPEMPGLLAGLANHRLLRLASLMDHTPGAGQYADLPRYRAMRARDGEAPDETERRIAFLTEQRARLRGPNRAALLDLLRGRAILASHDDGTEEEVAENLADGIPIAEFPTTLAAARAAVAGGQTTIAGAPNLVRGGSHTGNVAARALIEAGLVTALASDYVPQSLLDAVFVAPVPLPAAVAMVTAAPADMAGLADRGRLAPGLRADLVRVTLHEGQPIVREVYREGARVA